MAEMPNARTKLDDALASLTEAQMATAKRFKETEALFRRRRIDWRIEDPTARLDASGQRVDALIADLFADIRKLPRNKQ
jgi:hypothetical protein